MEVQVRKLYGISKAENLPINIEDAARSESEIEKALQVYLQLFYFFFLVRLFSVFVFIEFQSAMNIVLFISTDLHFFFLPSFCILIWSFGFAGWRAACSC